MQKFIIDRFEGSYAICETADKSFISIPKYKLPLESREGDCLVQDADGMFRRDAEARTAREIRIREKMNRLFE
ncbi:hypothetical protein HNQ56_004220 [Anaerotaenia torta]|uniref:DUF3006 domain-containing protein n=1 Tax=Anaerotaenia torta TaxID=433293 RepID=UPI003D1D3986